MASFDLHLSWLTSKLGVMLSPIMSKSPVSKRAGVIQLRVQGSAPIAQAVQLGDEFARMLKARDMNALRPWLAAAETSPLKGFAQSLRRDFDAVLAALCFRWSQGPVEGNVHRLKSVKRTMYGRGSFELLRQRVLYKPPD